MSPTYPTQLQEPDEEATTEEAILSSEACTGVND